MVVLKDKKYIAELGRSAAWTLTAHPSGFVIRGGASCSVRAVASGGRGAPDRGALCCGRAVALTSANPSKTFLMATAQRLVNLEATLNRRQSAEFEQLVMGERRTTLAAQIAPSSSAVVSSVAGLPGGIGYVSMGYLGSSIHAVSIDGVDLTMDTVYENTYPLRSTIYFVGLEEPQDDYRVFIGWVQSPAGQAVVARHYAPLLRP